MFTRIRFDIVMLTQIQYEILGLQCNIQELQLAANKILKYACRVML